MKLIIITKEWSRHGNYSGYEKIIEKYPFKYKVARYNQIPYKISEYLKRKTKLSNYNTIAVSKELFILFRIFTKKNIHVIYGDMDYYFLHYIKRFPFNLRKNKLIATFHHPPYELEKRLGYNRRKVLSALDKIIVMGPNQIPFFRKYTDAEIKFIPHGIDLTYFSPPVKEINRKNQILIIGVSHRDNKRNIQIINTLNNFQIKIKFKIIVPKGFEKVYENIPNVEIITENISDKELLKYFQVSKGILLSLIDCTASNTILEALGTGCPLFINDVGAVKDYIPKSSGIPVFKTEVINDTVEYIQKIIKDDEYRLNMSKKQRELAMNYDWKKVASITEDFIKS